MNIEKDRRICPTCLTGVETETHFLFDCPIYENLRKWLVNPIIGDKGCSNNEEKHIILFATRTCDQNLARFIRESFELRELLIVHDK